ncbi:hypothetical protein BDV93DRAFT_471477 [Ceratobasidium sp. AG-I]|nr:hypothetical protein BDV93DRAFT_471477 [Ceratobasidium sp. AG-I]
MTLPTFRTYLAPSTQSLLRHLGRLPAPPAASVNLFALSAQAEDLEDAVSYLTTLPNAIGGLTSSTYWGVQLSVASFSAMSCLPFRSTIPGIPQAEVGRIRTYRPPTQEDKASEARLENALASGVTNWNDAMSESGSLELPSDLEHARNKSHISSFVYLSDGAPEGLSDSLHRHFPTASQSGLIASSTPFVTGRPFTLFKGASIFSDGAVGLALFDHKAHKSNTTFKNIRPVSALMEVTQAQTNLVETLDGGNPAKSLLLAMNASNSLDKEHDVYLAVTDTMAKQSSNGPPSYTKMYKIMAGDPSRGSLLLDAAEGPEVGARVQFVILAKSKERLSLPPPPHQVVPTVSLESISDTNPPLPLSDSPDSAICEIDNLFLGTSENGFVVGSSNAGTPTKPWKCGLPGATHTVQWNM